MGRFNSSMSKVPSGGGANILNTYVYKMIAPTYTCKDQSSNQEIKGSVPRRTFEYAFAEKCLIRCEGALELTQLKQKILHKNGGDEQEVKTHPLSE